MGSRIKRVKKGSLIKKKGRLDVNERKESLHKMKAGEGG